ncbi:MAG TPA: HAMP domain-containing sensor histidine kinase [Candidatus Thermoplasmatota archaeon]|nr:HAMP domain-containing sensor histidine kinase [Candidatus Thermoplasmatota archaeon]
MNRPRPLSPRGAGPGPAATVPATPSEPAIRLAIQTVVGQTLRAVTAWLGPLLLAFAPLDYFFSPAPAGHTLAALDVALGLFFALVFVLVRSGRIPPQATHAGMGIVVLAVLPYLVANLLVTHDPVQSAGWALWQICLSLVMLSWPWMLGLLLVSNALWIGTVLALPPDPAFQQYGFVLATATTISVVAHGVRLRTIRRLEGLRLAEQARREELERVQVTAREVETVRQVNEAKTRFINTAAHELSTPMTPIVLQLAMLRKEPKGNLTPRQARSLDILERNVGRLNSLLHDVLDSARLQSDRFSLVPAAIDLGALMRQAVADHEDTGRAAGIRLTVEALDTIVQGDRLRLEQVLDNLLGNAIKFTPTGGIVRLAARREGPMVRVEVTDNGLGLPPGEALRLFRPFAQVRDPRAANVPGTGLGLFITKGIVEHHGGEVGCSSPGPGFGSTFWFTLPAA